jgi:hypothetical protein
MQQVLAVTSLLAQDIRMQLVEVDKFLRGSGLPPFHAIQIIQSIISQLFDVEQGKQRYKKKAENEDTEAAIKKKLTEGLPILGGSCAPLGGSAAPPLPP